MKHFVQDIALLVVCFSSTFTTLSISTGECFANDKSTVTLQFKTGKGNLGMVDNGVDFRVYIDSEWLANIEKGSEPVLKASLSRGNHTIRIYDGAKWINAIVADYDFRVDTSERIEFDIWYDESNDIKWNAKKLSLLEAKLEEIQADWSLLVIAVAATLIWIFQYRLIDFLIFSRFEVFKTDSPKWVRAFVVATHFAIVAVTIFTIAILHETNPANSAHENTFYSRKPLEHLVLNLDSALGAMEFKYNNYGIFSTRSMSLKMFGSPDVNVPMSYGFMSEVYLYDDERLQLAIDILNQNQR